MIAKYPFGRLVAAIYRYRLREVARQLEPFGIGAGQHTYLMVVRDEPGITQDRLTARLVVNKSSVARATAQLEKSGFLRRETDPADRRVYRLYLTQKGENLMKEMWWMMEDVNNRLLEGFSQEETQRLMGYLQRMMENIPGCGPTEKGRGQH